ncbi:hypothetical protein ACH3XW_37800 [Acanthocheilonema viteae]
MNANIGNATMDRYSILWHHIIIISIIIIATVASPTGNIYEKSNNYFATYNNEPDDDGNMLENYFDIDKRSKNSHSWMNGNAVRSSSRNLLFILEKPAPLNPYSWQNMIKKKSQSISRNPYSWMNYRNN